MASIMCFKFLPEKLIGVTLFSIYSHSYIDARHRPLPLAMFYQLLCLKERKRSELKRTHSQDWSNRPWCHCDKTTLAVKSVRINMELILATAFDGENPFNM